MIGRLSSVFFVFTAVVIFSAAWPAHAASQSEAAALTIRKRYLQERYQDFFIHMNAQDRLEQQRLRGADERRQARRQHEAAQEKARLAYIEKKKREKKVEPSPLEYEKEIRAQKERHEKSRQDYVRAQAELDNLQDTVGVIPGWVEYKLYPAYLVDDKPRATK